MKLQIFNNKLKIFYLIVLFLILLEIILRNIGLVTQYYMKIKKIITQNIIKISQDSKSQKLS